MRKINLNIMGTTSSVFNQLIIVTRKCKFIINKLSLYNIQ